MKNSKILLLFVCILFFSNTLKAQGFEGAQMTPEFASKLDEVGQKSIVGKKIFYTDYQPDVTFTPPAKMTTAEGMSYAMLLIRDPSLLRLKKGVPNFIYTVSGIICIMYVPEKKTWNMDFIGYTSSVHRSTWWGCRVMGFE
jgi:hypothetical protein